ncbi:uncharacterized protein YtmB [Paraliobacillus ryukyuensis]|uniref:Uncharacterized protein DUF2584 n=1 Tax=Paraliobacillus ryukyuensis TaxID=200904 RepID=A0A366EGX4_9BACI|nr:DUF2584 family protein [Paraliobacillus ryukyuensis]RBP01588.1 uncharacterized protein DUF2584 [Paraliobacillus ryukyuensis]
MSMPMSFEWRLVTEGNEKRVANKDNFFSIVLDGYRLFPLEEEIEIRRHQDADQIGYGKVVEITWKANRTICTYQLISLYSVN